MSVKAKKLKTKSVPTDCFGPDPKLRLASPDAMLIEVLEAELAMVRSDLAAALAKPTKRVAARAAASTEPKPPREPKPAPTPKVKPAFNAAQTRILLALAELPTDLNLDHESLAIRAKVPHTWLTGHTYKACKANTAPSLKEVGLVEAVTVDVDGKAERRYRLSEAGREAAAKLKAG